MSKKHLDEQKLLIENFNKWINEEEKISETDVEVVEEKQQVEEAIFTMGVAFGASKFVTSLSNLLGAYNDLTKVTDEMLSDPNTPEALRKAAAGATQAGADIKDGAGPIASDLSLGQQLSQVAIAKLISKHFGIKIDPSSIPMPGSSKPAPDPEPAPEPEPEPVPEPEPEDTEARTKLGLMSKDKEERLKQLRAKYRNSPEKGDA